MFKKIKEFFKRIQQKIWANRYVEYKNVFGNQKEVDSFQKALMESARIMVKGTEQEKQKYLDKTSKIAEKAKRELNDATMEMIDYVKKNFNGKKLDELVKEKLSINPRKIATPKMGEVYVADLKQNGDDRNSFKRKNIKLGKLSSAIFYPDKNESKTKKIPKLSVKMPDTIKGRTEYIEEE